jgi:hypothetical protein
MTAKPSAVSTISAGPWICVFLVVAIVTAHGASLRNGLVFDDHQYITNNSQVATGLSSDNFAWAWTTRYESNWHPLTWLSLQLDSQLYGVQSPWGFHLTNLLLHIANTLLLFSVLRRSTGTTWESGAVAAFFALHPLHVESVAWAAERKDLLSTLFGFLAMWFYLRYVSKPDLRRYVPVFITSALSLLAKPMLVTLPFVLLLLDYWPLGRLGGQGSEDRGQRTEDRGQRTEDRRKKTEGRVQKKRFTTSPPHYSTTSPAHHRTSWVYLLLEKLPLLALSVLSSATTIWAQHSGGAVRTLEQVPMQYRIFNALVSYVAYLGQMFWPASLTVFYPLAWKGIPLWQPIAAALVLAAVTILVMTQIRQRPYLLVGWLWYLGTLVPVIGLVQVGIQARADRYTYVPLVGIFMMLAWGLPELIGSWGFPRRVLLALAGLLLAACFVATWMQIGYWHDDFTLWSHAAQVAPDNATARNNAGKPLLDRVVLAGSGIAPAESKNLLAQAEDHFRAAVRAAVRTDPSYVEVRYNLGLVLAEQGKLAEADRQEKLAEADRLFSEVIQLDPKDTDALFHLGLVEKQQRKLKKAVTTFRQLLTSQPDDADARMNLLECLDSLAATYARAGDFDRAIEAEKQALAEASGHVSSAVLDRLQERIRSYENKKLN